MAHGNSIVYSSMYIDLNNVTTLSSMYIPVDPFVRCNRQWIAKDATPAPPPTAGSSSPGGAVQAGAEAVEEDCSEEEVILCTLY